MRKSILYITLGLVLLTSSYLLPLDVMPVATYRGYDVLYDLGTTHMYIVSGLTGSYSSLTAAKAAIDARLGPLSGINQPPHAEAGGPYSGKVGDTISLYSIGSFDPDGDAVTYYWEFGDGAISTSPSPQHAYSGPGVYSVRLNVEDPSGAEMQDVATVTIVAAEDPLPPPAQNKAPVAVVGGPYGGVVGATVTFSGAGSYDNDGYLASYQWSFGDGGLASGGFVQHVYAEAGEYTVGLIVTDNGGATSSSQTTVSIVVVPVNTDTAASNPLLKTGVMGLGVGFVAVGVLMRRQEDE